MKAFPSEGIELQRHFHLDSMIELGARESGEKWRLENSRKDVSVKYLMAWRTSCRRTTRSMKDRVSAVVVAKD